jgi:uncharacterized protein
MEIAAAIACGFAGGMIGGVLGVGGGIIFVPALAIFLGESQIVAVATSLVAIVPVAVVGGWRQHRFGNVRLREGLWVGALAPAGVAAGVLISNAVSERALEISFAALLLFVAARMVRRGLAPEPAATSARSRARP